MNDFVPLTARILMAQIFLISGFGKLGAGYAATGAYMQALGIPAVLLPLVIALEIAGGLALTLGFQTRWTALALALFCIVAGLIFHHNPGDRIQSIMFMKNLAMAGGLLLLSGYGAGALSVDANRSTARSGLRAER
ncbi:MAG: DoxX family protein [Puia sp.]|nr:DoxX family protein [Puia sp.]